MHSLFFFLQQLSTVIGATWLFAYVYLLFPNSIVVSYIYSILNSLQGVFIFLTFGCTSRVRDLWKEKMTTYSTSASTSRTRKSRDKIETDKRDLSTDKRRTTDHDTRV